MRKQIWHAIENSLDWTTLDSYGRGIHAPQNPNNEHPPQESQEPQPVCNSGVCELTWKPGRSSVA
ncbi:MAG: hypothetical protein DKT66_11775 [Candidatus Melainabacteria bacterium]|nr:MAG: hypothetical protein DKT66_11775 [Candidatus Melainabacteria bacterium]